MSFNGAGGLWAFQLVQQVRQITGGTTQHLHHRHSRQLDGACDTSDILLPYAIKKSCFEDRGSGHRMCNAAEQASADYSSDPQRNNVLISEMDDLVLCANTYARISEETKKAVANQSDVSAVTMSSAPSKKANGVGGDHSYHAHNHFAEEAPIPVRGSQAIAEELVDQKGVRAVTTSSSDKNGTQVPNFHGENFSKPLEYICDPNSEESEDDAHPICTESSEEETKPRETETLSENSSSKETKSQIEGEKFEKESSQEISKELVEDSVTLGHLPDGADGDSSIKAVDDCSCSPVSSGSQPAENSAKELSLDPCKGAENTETQPDVVHSNHTIEVDEHPALEGLGVGFQGHSKGPCSGHAAQSMSGPIQITPNVKEMEKEAAASSLETQNTPHHPKQMTQDVASNEHEETWIPTSLMSSEEDAAEDVQRYFKEANREIQSEIEQEDTFALSDSAYSKDSSRPELAKFFSNAKGSEPKKEIEEQEIAPVVAEVPLKEKLFMESPRSLRMLLFSEETALSNKKDEKHKKDGKTMDFSNKVVPAKQGHSNENPKEHNYPAKWYESSDNEEASSNFSGPMVFSGALTHQGVISYSGQIPYSGSISHRSDSSTSTRSFAFPILASEWNSSPARMGPPEPWFHRRPRRKWHFCFCCRCPSSWFD